MPARRSTYLNRKKLADDEVLMKLARLDSAVIVPHLGGHTEESQAAVWDCVMERVLEELN